VSSGLRCAGQEKSAEGLASDDPFLAAIKRAPLGLEGVELLKDLTSENKWGRSGCVSG